jgi:WD40 repeat protein
VAAPTCPSDDTLPRFLAGTLAAADEDAVSRHVEACAACQRSLDLLSADPDLPAFSPQKEQAPDDFLSRLEAVPQAMRLSSVPRRSAGFAPGQLPHVEGYEVLAEIGRGGMGVVYHCRHLTLGREVALKLLQSGLYPTQDDRARFRAEAEATARLQHPNIVQLYEVGECRLGDVGGPVPYLALEYVAGGNLQQRLQDRPQQPRCCARFVEVLARAVQAAHDAGVVHRDLKPANVLLTPTASPTTDSEQLYGIPKLTDFGLAKRLDADQISLAGTLSGTPGYMAPEQVPPEIAGGRRGAVGPATDTYALGAILYQMLTGRAPSLGPDWMTTLWLAVNRDPLPPSALVPGVARDLETICLKCLRKEQANRYTSAKDLADDLGRFLEGRAVKARPVGAATLAVKWARRRPWLASLLALVALTTVTAFAGLTLALSAERGRQAAERRASEALRERERQAVLTGQREQALRVRAEQSLYLSQVARARLMWLDGDVAGARLTLSACPKELRRWEWELCDGLCEDSLLTAAAPKGYEVRAVAWGGDWLAAASAPRLAANRQSAPPVVEVWDLAGKRLLRQALPATGTPLALAADGPRLVLLLGQDSGRTLLAWDRKQTGWPEKPSLRLEVSARAVLSPDGRLLADPARDGFAVRPLDGGEVVLPRKDVTCFAFSADGKRLALGGPGGVDVYALKRREKATAISARRLGGWAAGAKALALHPDGLRVACYEPAAGAAVLRDGSGKELASFVVRPGGTAQEQGEGVVELSFAPGGRHLVVRTARGRNSEEEVRVCDLLTRLQTPLVGHAGPVRALALSPDGLSAATAGDGGVLRLWDLAGGRPRGRGEGARAQGENESELRGHVGRVYSVAFDDEGRRLITGGGDGTARVWDLTRSQSGLSLRTGQREGVPFFLGDVLLVLGRKRLSRWDVRTGLPLAGERLDWHADSRAAAFAPQPKRLAVIAPGRKQVHLIDLDRPRALRRLTGHAFPITAVAISEDGLQVVSGSAGVVEGKPPRGQGELCVWDGLTGELLHRESGPHLCVTGLAIHAESRRAAVATGWPHWPHGDVAPPPAGLRLFDLGTYRLLPPLASHPRGRRVYSTVTFHSGGGQLASVGPGSHRLTVWDLARGKAAWEAEEPARITGLAYHPDTSRLAVATEAGAVVLRETIAGDEALRLPPLSAARGGQAVNVAFSADGRLLASNDWPGLVLRETGRPDHAARRAAATARAPGWHAALAEGKGFAAEFHARWRDRLGAAPKR